MTFFLLLLLVLVVGLGHFLFKTSSKLRQTRKQLKDIEGQVSTYETQFRVDYSGVSWPSYEFPDSETCQETLDELRRQQKEAVRSGQAFITGKSITIEGSEKKGLKLRNDVSTLMLRAFNGECDAIIANVTYKNKNTSANRIEQVFKQINKLGAWAICEISPMYHQLKLMELLAVYEYAELKQKELEEQRLIKERMREEERAERELRKSVADAEAEEQRWMKALKAAEAKLVSASEERQGELTAQIAQLHSQLQEALAVKERAMSMAQQTREGYVYIISNIGSFGEDVYKIGMTRRLEPMDRIKELGDASVPFAFDVHAFIHSKDAPALEQALHAELREYQVNKVNPRKEFFRTDLTTIEQAVLLHNGQFRLTRLAEAREYRESCEVPQLASSS